MTDHYEETGSLTDEQWDTLLRDGVILRFEAGEGKIIDPHTGRIVGSVISTDPESKRLDSEGDLRD